MLDTTVHFTPAHWQRGYHYLDFDVPVAATSLTVEVEADPSLGRVDLGLFDPQGFRGYSGSARRSFTLTDEAATPGYLPGPLPAGRWQLLLGLHRILADDFPVRVLVRFDQPDLPVRPDLPTRPARPERRTPPATAGRRWLAGDLHCHTIHSDGRLSPAEVAAMAVRAGLDFLAITDHNTVSHHHELRALAERMGLTLIPGQEVTTPRGHANVWGDIGWIDFREHPERWLAQAEARGGLMSINHPLTGDQAWLWHMTTWPPVAEIWHSSWSDRRFGAPLAWWLHGSDAGEDARPVAVGGSDFHHPRDGGPVGQPTTWVEADSSEVSDILAAIRAGRVAISADAFGPLLTRRGDEFAAYGALGLFLTGPDGRRTLIDDDEWSCPARPGPAWIEDREARIWAMTN